jgi:galactose mutarotase-like enzyme
VQSAQAKAKFSLDGTEYKLAVNNGEHSLHGGAWCLDFACLLQVAKT